MAGTRNACVYFFLSVLTIVLNMLAVPAPAAAQTVIDATTAEFQPSADHSATANDGSSLVNSYLLQIFATGSFISVVLNRHRKAKSRRGWPDPVRIRLATHRSARRRHDLRGARVGCGAGRKFRQPGLQYLRIVCTVRAGALGRRDLGRRSCDNRRCVCHGRHDLRLDGPCQRHMAHGDIRRLRDWRWQRKLFSLGEHGKHQPQRHPDHCRADVHGEPERIEPDVYLRHQPGQQECRRGG